MSQSKQRLGRWGEKEAESYLVSKAYKIVDRNFHCEHGEIDLIAQEGECLVFVEVKTRRGTTFGFPEEAVNLKKQGHIKDSAEAYLQEKDRENMDWRIDVIAILVGKKDEIHIEHFEDAIH